MQQMSKAHEKTMLEIQRRITDVVPAEQKVIIIVYDGPQLLTRQASWLGPGATNEEAAEVLGQIADNARRK